MVTAHSLNQISYMVVRQPMVCLHIYIYVSNRLCIDRIHWVGWLSAWTVPFETPLQSSIAVLSRRLHVTFNNHLKSISCQSKKNKWKKKSNGHLQCVAFILLYWWSFIKNSFAASHTRICIWRVKKIYKTHNTETQTQTVWLLWIGFVF